MEENNNNFNNIDEYIALYPQEVQDKLQALRKVIREAAPEAEEKISWRMPTFAYHGNLVHFAAFKNHIGLYPGVNGIEHFEHRFSEYKSSKGAVQFPLNKPIPFDLVREIVLFKVEENKKDTEIKDQKKKKQKYNA
ncbi:MAG TPA: DUF1801 domain-containing protein [Mobilitalea sp.]|nr:DUF1801 domain-containing protein [Mobilitalea sp.]